MNGKRFTAVLLSLLMMLSLVGLLPASADDIVDVSYAQGIGTYLYREHGENEVEVTGTLHSFWQVGDDGQEEYFYCACPQGDYYTKQEGRYEPISGEYIPVEWETELVSEVPEEIDGKTVTGIGDRALIHHEAEPYNIIGLPATIENLGKDALGSDGERIVFANVTITPGEDRMIPTLKALADYCGGFTCETTKGYRNRWSWTNELYDDEPEDLSSSFAYNNYGILSAAADVASGEYYIKLMPVSDACPLGHCALYITVEDPALSLQYPYKNESTKTIGYSQTMDNVIDGTLPSTYSPRLASMLCVMAQSAYDEDCVRENYRALGYSGTYAVYDFDTTYTQADNCGYVIGYRDVASDKRVYLITIRGTANKLHEVWGEEWWSDFNLGFSQMNWTGIYPSYHSGFYAAADKIWSDIQSYNDGLTNKNQKVTYIITGHSRGAAVGNLVASWLSNNTRFSEQKVYAYNFACPNVAVDMEGEFSDSDYLSIFNLGCSRDLVSQAPGDKLTLLTPSFWQTVTGKETAQWGKYGRTMFWDYDWDTAGEAGVTGLSTYHPCDTNYIPYFLEENGQSAFKTYWDMKQIQKSNFWAGNVRDYDNVEITVYAPVPSLSVQLKDSLDNVLASIKNGIVEIAEDYKDSIDIEITDGYAQIRTDEGLSYEVEVQSEEQVYIGVAQDSAGSTGVGSAAVYSPASGESVTVTVTPQTPAAEMPVTNGSGETVEPVQAWTLGDVTGDGVLSVLDAVRLQKWLVHTSGTTLPAWKAADYCADDRIDVRDLVLMKQALTAK